MKGTRYRRAQLEQQGVPPSPPQALTDEPRPRRKRPRKNDVPEDSSQSQEPGHTTLTGRVTKRPTRGRPTTRLQSAPEAQAPEASDSINDEDVRNDNKAEPSLQSQESSQKAKTGRRGGVVKRARRQPTPKPRSEPEQEASEDSDSANGADQAHVKLANADRTHIEQAHAEQAHVEKVQEDRDGLKSASTASPSSTSPEQVQQNTSSLPSKDIQSPSPHTPLSCARVEHAQKGTDGSSRRSTPSFSPINTPEHAHPAQVQGDTSGLASKEIHSSTLQKFISCAQLEEAQMDTDGLSSRSNRSFSAINTPDHTNLVQAQVDTSGLASKDIQSPFLQTPPSHAQVEQAQGHTDGLDVGSTHTSSPNNITRSPLPPRDQTQIKQAQGHTDGLDVGSTHTSSPNHTIQSPSPQDQTQIKQAQGHTDGLDVGSTHASSPTKIIQSPSFPKDQTPIKQVQGHTDGLDVGSTHASSPNKTIQSPSPKDQTPIKQAQGHTDGLNVKATQTSPQINITQSPLPAKDQTQIEQAQEHTGSLNVQSTHASPPNTSADPEGSPITVSVKITVNDSSYSLDEKYLSVKVPITMLPGLLHHLKNHHTVANTDLPDFINASGLTRRLLEDRFKNLIDVAGHKKRKRDQELLDLETQTGEMRKKLQEPESNANTQLYKLKVKIPFFDNGSLRLGKWREIEREVVDEPEAIEQAMKDIERMHGLFNPSKLAEEVREAMKRCREANRKAKKRRIWTHVDDQEAMAKEEEDRARRIEKRNKFRQKLTKEHRELLGRALMFPDTHPATEGPDPSEPLMQEPIEEQRQEEQTQVHVEPETPRGRRWGLGNLLPSVHSVSRFIPFSSRTPLAAAVSASQSQAASSVLQVSNGRPITTEVQTNLESNSELQNLQDAQNIGLNSHVISSGEAPAEGQHPHTQISEPNDGVQTAEEPKVNKQTEEDRIRANVEAEYAALVFEQAAQAKRLRAAVDAEREELQKEKDAHWRELEKQRQVLADIAKDMPGSKRKRSPDIIPNPPGGGYGMDLNYFGASDDSETENPTPTKKARTSSSSSQTVNVFSTVSSSSSSQTGNIFSAVSSAEQTESQHAPNGPTMIFRVPSPTSSDDEEEDEEEDESQKDLANVISPSAPDLPSAPNPPAQPQRANASSYNSLPAPSHLVEKARQKALMHQPKTGSRLRNASRLSSSTVGSDGGEETSTAEENPVEETPTAEKTPAEVHIASYEEFLKGASPRVAELFLSTWTEDDTKAAEEAFGVQLAAFTHSHNRVQKALDDAWTEEDCAMAEAEVERQLALWRAEELAGAAA